MSKRGKRSINGRAKQVLRRAQHEQRTAFVDHDDYAGTKTRDGVSRMVPMKAKQLRQAPSIVVAAAERVAPKRVGGELATGKHAKSGPIKHSVREIEVTETAGPNGEPIENTQVVIRDYEESQLRVRREAKVQSLPTAAEQYQHNGWIKY